MSLVQELIAALRAAIATIRQAQTGVTTARGHGADAHELIRAATDGSSDPRPGEAMVRLEQAQVRLDEATAEMTAGTEALEVYIAEALGDSTGAPPTGPPPRPRPTGGESLVPAAVRRLAEQLPVWEEDDPTRALAYSDEDGAEVEFVSGRDPAAREGLTLEYARRWVMDHAESKIAARMRQPGGHKQVTVVINNEPCGGVKGCDATMPDIIPAGAAVRIFVADSGTVRHFGTYRGTGKGIA